MDPLGPESQDQQYKHIELRSVLNRSVDVSPSLNESPDSVTIFTRREGAYTVDDVSSDSVTLRGAAAQSVTFALAQVKVERG